MPTYTPVIDNGGELYNVKAYGAVGDGTTDDAPAILSAIAATRKTSQYGTAAGLGQPVLIPSGIYKVNTPLDMTGWQINLRGSGPYQSVVRGNTGSYSWGVLLDMTGTGFSTVRDLLLDDVGMSSPSGLGILQARRPETGSDALCNHLSNVVVRLEHSASANNYNGTFGIVNVGCETTTYESVYVRATVALFLGSGNNLGRDFDPAHAFKAVSPYIGTIMENTSMTVVSVRGNSNLVGVTGPAVRIGGGADLDLGDSALLGQGPTINPYAIEVMATVSNLRYSGSVEGFPSLLKVQAPVTGLVVDCYMAHDPNSAHIVMSPGTSLTQGHINVVPNPGTSGGKLIQALSGTGVVVQGLDIDLYSQGIDLTSAGTLRGCVIRSTRSLAATKAGIVTGTRAGNVILATDGVHVDGVTTW